MPASRGAATEPQGSHCLTTYEERGVSAEKTDVKRAISGLHSNLFPGAFCWVVGDVFTGNPGKVLISHADGAGTKASVAYIQYKETGDPSVFRGIAQDSLAMNVDDMATIGCFGPYLFSNTIGRNAKLVGGDVISAVIDGYQDRIALLEQHGIHLEVCGGETADMGDVVRTIVVDSTLSAMMDRADVIDASNIAAGQAIVGIASYGQASYETRPNSGVGSNGFTALRHDLLHGSYRDKYPETFAPEIRDKAYAGRHLLSDKPSGMDMTVGEALLSPTRFYAPILAKIVKACRSAISGIIHNTGGGQTKCLNFGQGIHYVKDKLIPLPPLFELVRAETKLPLKQLARTFNLGTRMEIVCDEAALGTIVAIARDFGVHAQRVGHTEGSRHKRELTIRLGDETEHFVVEA
jgi:phosphoribosylformylglycinamidine cyclo-ligase